MAYAVKEGPAFSHLNHRACPRKEYQPARRPEVLPPGYQPAGALTLPPVMCHRTGEIQKRQEPHLCGVGLLGERT